MKKRSKFAVSNISLSGIAHDVVNPPLYIIEVIFVVLYLVENCKSIKLSR